MLIKPTLVSCMKRSRPRSNRNNTQTFLHVVVNDQVVLFFFFSVKNATMNSVPVALDLKLRLDLWTAPQRHLEIAFPLQLRMAERYCQHHPGQSVCCTVCALFLFICHVVYRQTAYLIMVQVLYKAVYGILYGMCGGVV